MGAVVRAVPDGQPALERLARDLAGRVKLVKVNVDQAPGLQARFTVEAVPALMLLRGPRVVARQAGADAEACDGCQRPVTYTNG